MQLINSIGAGLGPASGDEQGRYFRPTLGPAFMPAQVLSAVSARVAR
jgi:hypothetical protein